MPSKIWTNTLNTLDFHFTWCKHVSPQTQTFQSRIWSSDGRWLWRHHSSASEGPPGVQMCCSTQYVCEFVQKCWSKLLYSPEPSAHICLVGVCGRGRVRPICCQRRIVRQAAPNMAMSCISARLTPAVLAVKVICDQRKLQCRRDRPTAACQSHSLTERKLSSARLLWLIVWRGF